MTSEADTVSLTKLSLPPWSGLKSFCLPGAFAAGNLKFLGYSFSASTSSAMVSTLLLERMLTSLVVTPGTWLCI